ncbi:MAG TPA: DUF4331 domain-containing protein [Ktedonobacteraceae bacterium]|nr:DUF4331 domain-containing protein [Ktedonobacteraceae bacterium]
MSSHREAPEISRDPVADSTDLYAFVSTDNADTVTLIANYVPLEEPDGGPNFYEFGDDVLYEIHIDNDADSVAEITYQFRFQTKLRNPNTFLYNTGTITAIDGMNWNKRQFYTVTKVANGKSTVIGSKLACPPCNIGPLSTPNYTHLANQAIHTLSNGEKVFAGQRAEGFYVDLGAIFDLLDLRPFQNLHIDPRPATAGVNGANNLNVHSIALQIPKTHLTKDGSNPTDPSSAISVIGVWTSASRQKANVLDGQGGSSDTGPWMQVSRLGNPLVNEVVIPLGKKDYWNSQPPKNDSQFAEYVQHPEVAGLLPVLYPGVFPHLAGLNAARADLIAILHTGIPSGLINGFQNYTGKTQADMLRLNMAIAPASNPSIYGILGGDLAGYPNGRRVFDDVVAIELRAIAGVTYPLIDSSYEPDAAASVVTDGLTSSSVNMPYLTAFPYLGTPYDGFDTPSK